jgi:hypothetical protein
MSTSFGTLPSPFLPSPASPRRFLRFIGFPLWLSPVWRPCIASALACSASAGASSAGAALPSSPAPRHRRRSPPRAQGKTARDRVEPVPAHQDRRHNFDDDDGFSDVDESASGSVLERWYLGLSGLLLLVLLWWPVGLGVCGLLRRSAGGLCFGMAWNLALESIKFRRFRS